MNDHTTQPTPKKTTRRNLIIGAAAAVLALGVIGSVTGSGEEQAADVPPPTSTTVVEETTTTTVAPTTTTTTTTTTTAPPLTPDQQGALEIGAWSIVYGDMALQHLGALGGLFGDIANSSTPRQLLDRCAAIVDYMDANISEITELTAGAPNVRNFALDLNELWRTTLESAEACLLGDFETASVKIRTGTDVQYRITATLEWATVNYPS